MSVEHLSKWQCDMIGCDVSVVVPLNDGIPDGWVTLAVYEVGQRQGEKHLCAPCADRLLGKLRENGAPTP